MSHLKLKVCEFCCAMLAIAALTQAISNVSYGQTVDCIKTTCAHRDEFKNTDKGTYFKLMETDCKYCSSFGRCDGKDGKDCGESELKTEQKIAPAKGSVKCKGGLSLGQIFDQATVTEVTGKYEVDMTHPIRYVCTGD